MLVCVDAFTKWVEVVPLKCHDASSVAAAFVSVCATWGAPEVVRCDNGTEFVNAIVSALFKAFGVKVQHGAVRHPQSQGSVERFNRTLLTLIRKKLDGSDDWKAELDLLLFHYRVRPHGATRISPAEAMYGWGPRNLLVRDDKPEEPSQSAWVDRLRQKSVEIADYLEEQLSAVDFVDIPATCHYGVGEAVLFRRPDRHQKRQPPYESGWRVTKVIAPSTVEISSSAGGCKVVNVDCLKPDPELTEEETKEATAQSIDLAEEEAITGMGEDYVSLFCADPVDGVPVPPLPGVR